MNKALAKVQSTWHELGAGTQQILTMVTLVVGAFIVVGLAIQCVVPVAG